MGTRFRKRKWIAFMLSALMLTGTVPAPALAQARDAVGAALAQQGAAPAAQETASQDQAVTDSTVDTSKEQVSIASESDAEPANAPDGTSLQPMSEKTFHLNLIYNDADHYITRIFTDADSNPNPLGTVELPDPSEFTAPYGSEFDGYNVVQRYSTGSTFEPRGIAYDATSGKWHCSVYWQAKKTGSGASAQSSPVYVTPKWKAATYAINFDGNKPALATSSVSGSTASMNLIHDEEKPLTSNGFSLTGWTFDGWTTERNGNGTKYSDKASVKNLAEPKGSITLYAQWKQNSYTVKYDPNKPSGASGNVTGEIADSTLSYDDANSKLAAAGYSLDGWTFDGWNTKTDGTGTTIQPDTPGKHNLTATKGGSVTVFAQWRPNKFTFKFDKNKPTHSGNAASHEVEGTMANATFDYDSDVTLPANEFTLVGWTFDGWNTQANGKGQAFTDAQSVKNFSETDGHEQTLYAQWKQNTSSILFKMNKPENASHEVVSHGIAEGETSYIYVYYDRTERTLPGRELYTLEGWTFLNWNTKPDGSGTSYNGGQTTAYINPEVDGYTELFAQWAPTKSTIYFDNNEGVYNPKCSKPPAGDMQPLEVMYDSGVKLPKCAFTREGWHFTHWSTSEDPAAADAKTYQDEQDAGTLNPTGGDFTLHAHYAPDSVKLTFNPKAPEGSKGTVTGMPDQPIEWAYDSDNTIPTNPTLKGYKFWKWTITMPNGTEADLPGNEGGQNEMISEFYAAGISEVAVDANWIALEYRVEYNGNPPSSAGTVSNVPEQQTFKYDVRYSLDSIVPTCDGYEFDGWATASSAGGTKVYAAGQRLAEGENLVDDPDEDGTSTVTLYAQWKATTTTITFDSNGGPNAPAAKVATYGSFMPAIDKSELPTRRGYSFDGFYDEAADTGTIYYNADGTPAKAWDKTGRTGRLYAHWTKNKAKVTVSSELDDSEIAHDYYTTTLVEYESGYEETKSADVAVGDKAPAFAKVPRVVTETIGSGDNVRTIEHRLVGWRWDYTGADGKDYSGMLPVVNASGDYDTSYTQVTLNGLPEDAPEGATIDLKADYETFPFVGAMAENGTAAMALTAANYHDAKETIEVVDLSDKSPADVEGAIARFKTNGENWKLADNGVELVDQHGARGKVALTTDLQHVSMKADGRDPYTIDVTVGFEENDRNNGKLVFNSYPDSGEAGVPMTLLVSATYVPVQTTYDFSVMYQQADGTYKEEGTTTKSDPVDAGSEVPLDIKDAKPGYHFSRALYKDDYHPTPQSSSLPVRYNGSTNVIYYYDLDTYTATLSTDPQTATLVDGAAGWKPANDGKTWTRDFTVLDEVTLPTAKADDYTQQFLGWNLSTSAGEDYAKTLPAGTVVDVKYVASWRELAVPKPVTGGGETTYDGNEHETPITLPEGYTVDEDGNVYDESGRKIGHLEGDTTNTDAGEHHVKLVYEDGYIGEGGKTEEDLVYTIKPTDVTGKDGKPAATVDVSGADYNGKAQTPKPTVTYNGKTLQEGKDYTVSYSNNTMPGTATMTVTFKGNYTGTIKKTFTIKNTTRQMFRLYNPNSGEHFYTANAHERDVVKAAGWTYEGIGWIAPATGDPVYRLYNKGGGEHHYTMSKHERDALVKAGWNYEGIGWYSDQGKNVKVLREYNPNQFANNHNYTTSGYEHKTLIGLGWRDEGVGWYAVRAS